MKSILWLGLILLIGGGILVFISGSLNSAGEPMIPALSSTQMWWTVLAVIGLALTLIGVIGAIVKRKS